MRTMDEDIQFGLFLGLVIGAFVTAMIFLIVTKDWIRVDEQLRYGIIHIDKETGEYVKEYQK